MHRDERLLAVLLTVAILFGVSNALGEASVPTMSTCPSILHHVDPNRAGWAELTVLSGVGDVLARRIVDERRRHGPFRKAEDLARVSGIGPILVSRFRSDLRFDSQDRTSR